MNLTGLEEIVVEISEREVRHTAAIDYPSDIHTTISQQGPCLARVRD
jgi:hypothetical protein